MNPNTETHPMEHTEHSRNIYIIGAQSTGKTTLVNALEKFFESGNELPARLKDIKPTIIREVARTVLKTHNFTRDDISTSPMRALNLQELILEAQLKAEDSAIDETTSDKWFISDRSGVDPMVYAKLYAAPGAAEDMMISTQGKSVATRMQDGIVFLCEAGCDFLTDDGIRLMPENLKQWLLVNTTFDEILQTLGIDRILIPKGVIGLDQRVKIVLNAICSLQ